MIHNEKVNRHPSENTKRSWLFLNFDDILLKLNSVRREYLLSTMTTKKKKRDWDMQKGKNAGWSAQYG
jgi:hypothetical protein